MSGLQADDTVIGHKHDPALAEPLDGQHKHHEEDGPDGDVDHEDHPTEEEMQTLRRVSDKVPWKAFPIAFVELCERFSYYGTTVVFTNYLQQSLPPGSTTGAGGTNGQSGALGLQQRASTGLTTFNNFWIYVIPLFGAYVADTYWGRYKTICYAIGIAIFGHILLIISALPRVIANPNGAVACFSVAIVIMGIGTGAFKSNISPLVAEQYKGIRMRVVTTKTGERVIVDPSVTISRIYQFYYLCINIGALIGQISMVYAEKYVGFWLSFTLPTIILCLCPLVMFWGRNKYVRAKPEGSILGKALQHFMLAMKGRFSLNPMQFYRNLHDGTFWSKARPSSIPMEQRPAFMTYDDQWADEVMRGFKACSVFLWYPVYWLTYSQLNNNLTSQAATMALHGVPNDVLSNLDPFALIILIPICDMLIYPALRKAGINFSPLKKITLGFGTGALAMVWAAVIQHYIYKKSPCGYHAATCTADDGSAITVDINVWAQTGSYVLIAISEILASITGLEYAFTKAPKNMRSLVMSVFLFMNAFSSAIAEAFVTLAEDPLLVWNYGVFAVIAWIAMFIFYFQYRSLDKEEDKLNEIQAGHVATDARDEEESEVAQVAEKSGLRDETKETKETRI